MSTAKLEKKIWKLETKLREEFRAELQHTMADCIARVEKLESQIYNKPIFPRKTSEEESMIQISVDSAINTAANLKDSFSIDDLAVPTALKPVPAKIVAPVANPVVVDAAPAGDDQEDDNFEPVGFMESTWSMVLVLGLTDAGWFDELMGLLLLLGSATVQIIFTIILLTDAFLGDPFSAKLESARSWRRSAHDHSYMDLAGSSLVSRVCNQDDSLILSNAQAGIIAEINSFLGLGLLEFETAGLRPGMVLSTLCILLWCLYLLKEFRLVGTGVEAILHVARSGATTFEHGSFRTISYFRCWFFCFTSLMRMAIAAGILYAGIIWLANTASITELMLNAVALGSVMEVDEMIFSAMMPKRIQNRVQELEAVKICFTRRRSQCEALVLVLLILGLLLWPWHFLLEPLGSTMQQVKHAYCGGERDFVVAMNDDIGVILARGTESYQRTDHDNATLIETAVQDYAFVGFSDFVSFQESGPAFANKRAENIADAASTVQSCNDFDAWFVFGKAKSVIDFANIYAVYWRTVTFSLGFGENTTCAEMVNYCDRSSLLRLVCGPTCGCQSERYNSWFMVEAQGCSRVCLQRRREFVEEARNHPETCIDVERDDERWLALWDSYPAAAASYGKIIEPAQLEHLSWTALRLKEVGCAALQNNDGYQEPVTKAPWCAGFAQFFSPLSELCPATCLGCGDYSCQDVRTGMLQALAPHLNATDCADIVARRLCDQPGLEAASLYCCQSCDGTHGGQDRPDGDDGDGGEADGENEDGGHDGAEGADGASENYGSADDGVGAEGDTGYGDGEGTGDGDDEPADEAGYGGDGTDGGEDDAGLADEVGYGDDGEEDGAGFADEAGHGGDGDVEDGDDTAADGAYGYTDAGEE
ncbi:serS [Symbiodinium sp. CCMP2456]|nr:serS [Symbiodinium sp. CCMP2456]